MIARLCLTLLLLLGFPAGAQADHPRTGFEVRAGSSFTTLTEEATFLSRVDSYYGSRADVSVVGSSVQGRPLRLVRVGPLRTQAEIASGSSILLVCTQHGNEQAGRESCLRKLRDHAGSTSGTSLLVMPLANPDGFAKTSRYNASGIDINRDHQALKTPEARAIEAVMDAYKPDVTLDHHEYSDTHRPEGERVEYSDSKGRAPTQALNELSRALVYDWIVPGLKGDGFLVGPYDSDPTSTDKTTLNGAVGDRLSVGALIETPREGKLSRLSRVRAQYVAASGGLRFRYANEAALIEATDPVQSIPPGESPTPDP